MSSVRAGPRAVRDLHCGRQVIPEFLLLRIQVEDERDRKMRFEN